MRLSFIATVPCYILLLFAAWTLCSIASSSLHPHDAHSQAAEQVADLIAMDLIKGTGQDQNASFNCWISAVESLLLDGWTEPISSCTNCPNSSCHHQSSRRIISPGTGFCSNLSNTQKQLLALRLTKCYLEESNRFVSMPESCQIENISSGGTTSSSTSNRRSTTTLRQCLFDLTSEGFLVYTQFYLHTDLACTKLTSELLIHRKLEAAAKFQETALRMEQQVRRVFVLQQGIIMDMKEQKDLLQGQRVIIQSMEMDIDVARENMISLSQSFVEEQEKAILSLKEMYDGSSGLKQIWESFQPMVGALKDYGGNYMVFVLGRFLLLLSSLFVTMMVLPSWKSVMKVICILTIVDVAIESMARHDQELTVFNNVNLSEFLLHQRQKRMDVFVYFVVILLSLFGNWIYSSSKTATKDASKATTTVEIPTTVAVLTKKDMEVILDTMEQHRMETKRHQEEIRQHLVSLQQQLLVPSTLQTISSRTNSNAIPLPVKHATVGINHDHGRGARFATPTAAESDSSGSDIDDDDDDENHSIAIVSSSKMPIVTPSTNLQSRLATRESCHEHAQVSISIPTSIESPLASPMKSSEEKINHLLCMGAGKSSRQDGHKRKYDSDLDSEHSQISKRQRNSDDDNDNIDSSNHDDS